MRGFKVAILTAATAWAIPAMADDDAFKQAVNYVFSVNVDGKTPQLVTSIVDENRCIISVETPGNSWLYYLKEIRADKIMIDEKNGRISFEGDGTIVEEQAIKEAVDQGYQPNVERYPEMEGISPLQIAMAMQADVFIDPAFWKALGKKRGWTTDDDFKYWQKSVVEWEGKYWKKFWHRFIDHLAEGKDAESFFQSLDSKSRERPDSHH